MAQERSDQRASAPIYLSILLPVLGLALLAAVLVWDAVSDRNRAERLAMLTSLSIEASKLAHELQKERGMSAGFVGSAGSQFTSELQKQRQLTDAMMAQVAELVIVVHASNVPEVNRAATDRAARLKAGFAEIMAMRQRIDSQSITVPELAGYYTGMIRDLLSISNDPLVANEIDPLARLNVLYNSVLMAKEFAGVERAAGSVGFGQERFTAEVFDWYRGLQQRQFQLFDRMRAIGTPQERQLLEAALKSPAAQRLADLRAIAAESVETADVKGVTGPEWFAASTAYLGELLTLERRFAALILDQANASAASSLNRAVSLAVGVLLVILAIGLFGARYARRMVRSLLGLRDAIVQIERAEEGIDVPAHDRRDAIGEIARSLSSISGQGADSARVKAAMSNADAPFLVLDGQNISRFENAAFSRVADRHRAVFDRFAPTRADGARMATPLLAAVDAAVESGKTVVKQRGNDAIELDFGDAIFEVQRSPVVDRSGATIGASLQIEDVTDVRSLEKDIMRVLKSVEIGEFTDRVSLMDDLGFSSLVARGLNRQMDGIESFMDALVRTMSSMAEGDLTQSMATEFQGGFERARLRVNENLRELIDIVTVITASAHQVQGTSQPIAASAGSLARQAEDQATTLEQVNATMERISIGIGETAARSGTATELVKEAVTRAQAGNNVLGETQSAMSRIQNSSSKIVEIISVIDGIAFQTNLLALNAAVEAARAGEAGKGFAVVSSEVRTLAQRSGEAAAEIRTLISESSQNVAEGVALVDRTRSAIGQVHESIDRLGDVISKIAGSSTEQAHGAKEISQTISHLDTLTQQNSEAAGQSAHAAQTLLAEADHLIAKVTRFTVTRANAESDARHSRATETGNAA
ncbi:MAG: methyl-accepting chemotaxis protein [Pseudomonadota bacterium]